MGNSYLDTRGVLLFSESKIELDLELGDIYEGIFEIEEEHGMEVEGFVCTSSVRVALGVTEFNGTVIKIPYEIDTAGMQPGDTLKGNISIISNCGEYILPFSVMIVHSNLTSSMGHIKNLFHFTNLAKNEWDEAADIFASQDFLNLLHGNDAKYRDLYLGLTKKGNKNFGMEEFLIGINKKQALEYSVNAETIRLVEPRADIVEEVTIERNGWGYTLLAIKAKGDFIELSTNRLEGKDFVNNVCAFQFVIKENKLAPGRNFGRIVFKHLYGEFQIDIIVSNSDVSRRTSVSKRRNGITYSLMRHYIDYELNRISREKWITLTEDIINHRASVEDDYLENNMYKAALLLAAEKYNEAKWILDRQIKEDVEEAGNELYSFYLYLLALYSADEYYTREVCAQIRSIYDREQTNWRVAVVLIKVMKLLKTSPSKIYNFALEQIGLGCNSPLLLAEIVNLLNDEPTLLMRLDSAERQVVLFASDNGVISDDLGSQIVYHVTRLKSFDSALFKALTSMYDEKPDNFTLEAICTQLVRGGKKGPEYVVWYELGIEANMAINNIYEYYMASIDMNDEVFLPRTLLMYFSYQNNLPIEQSAFLYAYVLKNKEDLSDLYVNYRDDISRFVVKQLYAGMINRDLAYLYNELILGEMATEDNIRMFADLLLTYLIRVDDPMIDNVIVIDERLKDELVFPVSAGVAYVTLPSSEYTILLEDVRGNRYYMTKSYSTERFFLPRKILPQIEEYADDSLILDLYICDGSKEFITVNDRNVDRYRFLATSDGVSDSYRAAIRLPLIRYYLDEENINAVDEILESVSRDDVPYVDRNEFVRTLIARGMLDKAFDCIIYYGPEETDAQIVVRFLALVAERDGYVEDDRLVLMAWSAFDRGKYNEASLTYLSYFYRGTVKNLRNIWKATSGFYVDSYKLCENMLMQSLSTGAYIGEEVQVIREYSLGGGHTDLLLSYLVYLSSEYFINDRIVDDFIFQEIGRIYDNEGRLPDVCMLAFLKFYSENVNASKMEESIKTYVRRFIHILYAEKGMMLPFMKNYKTVSMDALEMANLSMVEYHGSENARVTINYCINRDEDVRGGYTREELSNVYGGIYVKSFMLFFGETLQYYITENVDGMEQLTESGTISNNDVESESGLDRYGMVNDIAISTTLKDYDTSLALLEEYMYKEYLVNNLFRIQ